MKRLMPLAVAVLLLFHATPAHAATQSVSMINGNKFDPATKTVNRGDKVLWTNTGFSGHTSTGTAPLSLWGSAILAHNKTFTSPALGAGTYPYFCTQHQPFMKGTIKVPLGIAKSVRKITLTLNTVAADATHKYVVQQKVGSAFKTIATVSTPTYVFNAPAAGTFTFRAALQKNGTTSPATFFSAPASIAVT